MLIFLITSLVFVLITLLPLFPSNHWVVRVWEFPRLQISALIIMQVALGYYFLPANLIMLSGLTLSLMCLVYQLHWILPYTKLYPTQVERDNSSAKTVRVLASNVLMSNKQSEKLLTAIKKYQPDIFVTLESNLWWQKELESLAQTYPYQINKPLENLYGMHVFSRFPLSDIKVTELIQKDIPSIHCKFEMDEETQIQFHFLHPAPPSPTENTYSKARDKELVLMASHVSNNDMPTIVAGDLNDVAWSPTTRYFIKKSGFLDPRVGRGFFNTFHAQHWFLRWPLDHLFHNQHFKIRSMKRLAEVGSDHFPLLTELAIVTPETDKNKSQNKKAST